MAVAKSQQKAGRWCGMSIYCPPALPENTPAGSCLIALDCQCSSQELSPVCMALASLAAQSQALRALLMYQAEDVFPMRL